MSTPTFSIEDFGDNIDSLYRLVIVASRRANQLSKPEMHRLIGSSAPKPTMVALEEIREGKVSYQTGESDADDLFE